MVKEAEVKEHTPALLQALLATIVSSAKVYCLEERLARGLHIGRDCRHVKTVRRRYLAGTDGRAEIWSHARFCVRCGQRMTGQDIPAAEVTTIVKAATKAAEPKVRKHGQA
jgi:hypothetical protein